MWIKNHKWLFLSVILGAIGGFLYYTFIGCNSSCSITSSPMISSFYGALLGGILFSDFKKKSEKQEHK
jgi:hypothetical protein